MKRSAKIERTTKETRISLNLTLPGEPGMEVKVDTGLPFLDHLLTSLAFYAGLGLVLSCEGDLQVDDHHSAEDCAITLGLALRDALGDRAGICRFGSAYAPLDEALARAVVDISGRACSVVDLGLKRETIGTLACENISHFVTSLATASLSCIHLDVIRGDNDHHRAEAAFKALGLALGEALSLGRPGQRAAAGEVAGSAIPSLKGSLGERGVS